MAAEARCMLKELTFIITSDTESLSCITLISLLEQTLAIFWTFGGVIAIICCVLAIAKHGRHNATYVFTDFDPQSGWTPGWAFCVGLLHAAYATSASGMILS